jgi:integrase
MAKKVEQDKGPVQLRFKKLKNGGQSAYLDIYFGGVRTYEFLKIYLRPGNSKEDKQYNKEQLALANRAKVDRMQQLLNGSLGLKDYRRAGKDNFIIFLQQMADAYESNGQTACCTLMRSAIRRLIDYKGPYVTFNGVDKEYLLGFIDYLNHDHYDFDKKKGGVVHETRPLSGVYKEALFARIMVALNKAEREGIIIKNPGREIDPKLKPRSEQNTRCYLTLEEVQKIIATPYRANNHVKEAFLFACFTGLRYSDIYKMTWGELKVSSDGTIQLETKMKKTKKELFLPLSDNALKWIPERNGAPDDQRVFYLMPDQPGNADARLHTLIKHAGIKKPVSFHVGRHTFATLTLTYGADLYTVSKLLGHTNIRTTQIYAKIVDANKRKAVNLIPEL